MTISLIGQVGKIKIKRDKDNTQIAIVGTWENKINKTQDGKEYYGLICKDTMQYLSNGKYIWRQCGIRETGSWKVSSDGKTIILYERWSKHLQEYLKTTSIGDMHIRLIELDRKHFVSLIMDEELGDIEEYYYSIK